jgi:hypothetical protein
MSPTLRTLTNLMATVCELRRFVPARHQVHVDDQRTGGLGFEWTLLTFEDDTERTLSDLLAYFVMHADDIARARGMAPRGREMLSGV